MKPTTKNQISWHLKDLIKRDLSVATETAAFLAPRVNIPSEVSQGKSSKLLMARYLAANMILQTVKSGNPASYALLMDRTEGKLAEKVQIDQRNISVAIVYGEPGVAHSSASQALAGADKSDLAECRRLLQTELTPERIINDLQASKRITDMSPSRLQLVDDEELEQDEADPLG